MVDVRDRRHVNQACVDSAQQPLDLSRGFGTVIMRVWSGAPEAVTTVAATVAVLWLVETKRPYAWVGALAAMYAYSGLRNAMRTRGGFQSTTVDHVGIVIKWLLPAFACAIAAMWYHRRRVVRDAAN